jgi:hypothetical protein
MRTAATIGGLVAVLVLVGCAVNRQLIPEPAPTAVASARSAAIAIAPVSGSEPGPEATTVFTKCRIGEEIAVEMVSGMGKVSSASDLARYVPLTGREPQLKAAGPVWIITIRGDVPQPKIGEIWTDPTCIVTSDDFGYFATGPVRNATTGAISRPEPPAIPPDLALPSLAP